MGVGQLRRRVVLGRGFGRASDHDSRSLRMVEVERDLDRTRGSDVGASTTTAVSSFSGRPSNASRRPSRPAATTVPAAVRRNLSTGRAAASPRRPPDRASASSINASESANCPRPRARARRRPHPHGTPALTPPSSSGGASSSPMASRDSRTSSTSASSSTPACSMPLRAWVWYFRIVEHRSMARGVVDQRADPRHVEVVRGVRTQVPADDPARPHVGEAQRGVVETLLVQDDDRLVPGVVERH